MTKIKCLRISETFYGLNDMKNDLYLKSFLRFFIFSLIIINIQRRQNRIEENMKNHLHLLNFQTERCPSIASRNDRFKRKNADSKSPRTPFKNKALGSPGKMGKMKILKLNSCQLFKEAHKTNGETFLKEAPNSVKFPIRVLSIASKGSQNIDKIPNLLAANNEQEGPKLEINRAVEINIFNPEGELTRLINNGLNFEEAESWSFKVPALDTLIEDPNELLKKNSSKKDDTLQQLLNSMKVLGTAQ